ncbi:MAG: hypothetical protein NTY11_01965 [Candidatus Parcubacteria bacterium]|nr:hypothetical protein [Candidatus Parcubacteria bacterium]
MTSRFKRNLFFLICALFLIITPIIVMSASGYRFDFANGKIVQIGGLFFKTSPPGVTVYIDDKPYKKTNFFFDTVLINNLLPRNYHIAIQKTDFYPWEKNLSVEQRMVTESKNIVLFPKYSIFNLLQKNIINFFPSPDEKKAILEISENNAWSFFSFDFQTQKQEKILNENNLQILKSNSATSTIKNIANTKPSNIIWSSDSKKILIELTGKGEKSYLITEPALDKDLFVIDWDKKIKNIGFNPNNSNEVLFISYPLATSTKSNTSSVSTASTSTIFIIRGNGEEIPFDFSNPFLKQNILRYAIVENNILWLGESGFLYKGTIDGNKISLIEIMNVVPLSIKPSATYQIIAKNISNIFIKEDEGLFYLNTNTHSLDKIFDLAKEIVFSKDAKKIAVNSGNQIWLYYFEEEKSQPQRKAGDKILLFSSSGEIKNLHWLNNYYLIFRVNESIKITEIDDRYKPNSIELTTFPNPTIFWLSNKLFVLSNNNLFLSEDILK